MNFNINLQYSGVNMIDIVKQKLNLAVTLVLPCFPIDTLRQTCSIIAHSIRCSSHLIQSSAMQTIQNNIKVHVVYDFRQVVPFIVVVFSTTVHTSSWHFYFRDISFPFTAHIRVFI